MQMMQPWMSLTAILIIGIALVYFVVIPLERKINNFLKRKIEEYEFKKDCRDYGVSHKVQDMEDSLRYMACFDSLNHTASTVEHKFKRGELKNLVLKHIKNRKGITIIQLGVLIPGAKENSIRKSIASLKRDGVIESRRFRKTKYVQYFLKKDVDAVGDK